MSTKKENTTIFDPASMTNYHRLTGAATGYLTDLMQNPFQSAAFKARVQMGNNQALNLGNRMKSNILLGYKGPNLDAFRLSQLNRVGRATAGMQSRNLLENILQQSQLQHSAAGMGLGFNPLQTGSVQKTSGAGTWAPQLLGAGLQAGMAALTGGASVAAGAAGGAAGWSTPDAVGSGAAFNSGNPFMAGNSMFDWKNK